MIILHVDDQGNLLQTILGDDAEDFKASLAGSWIEVAETNLPDAPRSAWVVDWAAGTVTIDPNWVAPTPRPAYSLAWADLITSALYQRVLGLAQVALPVNTAMFLFTAAFQAYMGDLPHEVWASALSASAGHLATAINTTDTPLTDEERSWVDLWNVAHNLGLTINWEAL